MEKKIFFIDFDGTLMRDDKTISDKNRKALRNAVDQGHYIALATGRAVSSGRRIAKELGLKQEEIICVGDAGNDKHMIEYAGLGVAMGNATDEIKEMADYVTLSNDEDGVAHVINKFILEER